MLGPVEVWDGREALAMGGPNPRTLLARCCWSTPTMTSMASLHACGPMDFEVEWDDLLPGYRRFYSFDPFGNRIEFLTTA